MKKLLLLCLLLPALSKGQEQFAGMLARNDVDTVTNGHVKCSYWQVFERGNFRENLNTFYSVANVDGVYYIDLKVMHGGDSFIVPRNGELGLMLENGKVIKLYNSEYKATSRGAGARGWAGSGAEGVILSYKIEEADVKALLHDYVERIRIYTGETFFEKRINRYHRELFMDEVALVYYAR